MFVTPRCGIVASLFIARRAVGQHANIWKIAVPLRIIKSVPDYKFVRDFEAGVIRMHWQLAPRRFVQQYRHPKTFRLMPLQQPFQKRQR